MANYLVELYGTARLTVGSRVVEVEAPDGARVGEVLTELGHRYPGLLGPVLLADLSGLSAGYVANLNGTVFVSDLETVMTSSDSLLLVPAASGGCVSASASSDSNAAWE